MDISALRSRGQDSVKILQLLVPLVEEGWTEGDVPRQAIRRYVSPLLDNGIGSLVLGCTHYPLLKESLALELQSLAGRPVPIVDSGTSLAAELKIWIESRDTARAPARTSALNLYVTDTPRRFQALASRQRFCRGLRVRSGITSTGVTAWRSA